MFTDVLRCPNCGINVYLAHDEDYCPLCGDVSRDEMEVIEYGVDLEEDYALGVDAKYAHIAHLYEILELIYGCDAGLYVNDCWEHAWDATLCDYDNAENLSAFLENPNEYLRPTRMVAMSTKQLKDEIQRQLSIGLSQCFHSNSIEEDVGDWLEKPQTSFRPKFVVWINKKLTSVFVSIEKSRTPRMRGLVRFVDRNNEVPPPNEEYIKFNCSISTEFGFKGKQTFFIRNIASYIANKVTKKGNLFKRAYLWWFTSRSFSYAKQIKNEENRLY